MGICKTLEEDLRQGFTRLWERIHGDSQAFETLGEDL